MFLTGCGADGSALRLGRRGRQFESGHPDKTKEGILKVTPSFIIYMFISFAPPKEMNQRK